MIYSPNSEARIHQHMHDLEHQHTIRRGQRRKEQLELIEKHLPETNPGLVRRLWRRITGSRVGVQ